MHIAQYAGYLLLVSLIIHPLPTCLVTGEANPHGLRQ